MNNRTVFLLSRIVCLGGIVLATLILLTGCDRSEKNVPTEKMDSQHTLRIVGLFPMTGPGASIGTFLQNGLTLAKEKLEQEYQGKLKIELEVVDTKNQPKEAVSGLYSAITRRKPHAVISALSSVSSAVKPVVESEGVFTVATTTALSNLVQGTKYLVRIYPTAENFAEPISTYAGNQFSKVAVLYIHDDFGDSVYNAFHKALEGSQTKIVTADAYELLQKDTRSLVGSVLSQDPEAIYVIGYGPAYISVIKQVRELSPKTAVLSDLSFPNPAVLAALGDAAEGVVFDGTDAELTEPETEAATHFRKLYIERFQAEPFMVAGFAYDSLVLITHAAMSSGEFTVPDKALAIQLSPFNGIMGEIQLSEQGESDISLKLMKRVDKKNILLKK